mmetsp:Transcript_165/g.334  ORF Transcript_165/g.334 Transcript_165/m.334 type:complete len:81 (+) Transcript_165:779-1021(+)
MLSVSLANPSAGGFAANQKSVISQEEQVCSNDHQDQGVLLEAKSLWLYFRLLPMAKLPTNGDPAECGASVLFGLQWFYLP